MTHSEDSHSSHKVTEHQPFLTLRRVLMIVVAMPLVFVFCVLCVGLASRLPFFYYADFRYVESRLEAIPNVTIVKSWKNEDTSLESCEFELAIDDCPPILIYFSEYQNWREMFDEIRGAIVVKKSRHFSTAFSIEEINAGGLEIHNLEDLLAQMPKVLDRFEALQDMPARKVGFGAGPAVYIELGP